MNTITVYTQTVQTAESLDELLSDAYDHRELTETLLNSRPSASMDELDEVYSDWNDAVNMTATELSRWSENPCSREASVSPSSVIKRNLRLLETNKSEWETRDIADAKRTISFIARMDSNTPESPQDGAHGCPTDWAISMLNWAHNPFSSLPERPDDDALDSVDAIELSVGDLDAYSDSITAYRFGVSDELSAEAGDYVELSDGKYGLITEVYTDNFRFPGGEDPDSDPVEVEVDSGDQVYLAVIEDGRTQPLLEDDFDVVDRMTVFDGDPPEEEKEDIDETDESELIDASDEITDDDTAHLLSEAVSTSELATVNSIPGITRTQRGQSPWPKSWRDSDKPARLIAMDAWQSMGMTHTGCTRSMRGKIARHNAFCAAFKDAIYGHTYWRSGGN